jgi:hypothetical protein
VPLPKQERRRGRAPEWSASGSQVADQWPKLDATGSKLGKIKKSLELQGLRAARCIMRCKNSVLQGRNNKLQPPLQLKSLLYNCFSAYGTTSNTLCNGSGRSRLQRAKEKHTKTTIAEHVGCGSLQKADKHMYLTRKLTLIAEVAVASISCYTWCARGKTKLASLDPPEVEQVMSKLEWMTCGTQ